MASMKGSFNMGGSMGMSFWEKVVLFTSNPQVSSDQVLKLGNFFPASVYLFPDKDTTPSSPNMKAVSLYPHPFSLNQSNLFLDACYLNNKNL